MDNETFKVDVTDDWLMVTSVQECIEFRNNTEIIGNYLGDLLESVGIRCTTEES